MAEVQPENFTLPELVDLALCSPEVGAVNFNILRILLQEILRKISAENEMAHLDDLQAHQIQNFKNYIQGAGTASPMPGVLRYNPPEVKYVSKTPRTDRSSTPSAPALQPKFVEPERHSLDHPPDDSGKRHSGSSGGGGTAAQPSGSKTARNARPPPPSARDKELETKVARLERHLEALYALPTNSQILGENDKPQQGMNVNDMWQIIQLNNRIAAAEAAIQKMASLIEDLAKEMKTVKSDAGGARRNSENVAKTNTELNSKMEPIGEKCSEAVKAIDNLKAELDKVKRQWKDEMEKLQKATGVDLGRIPSFMIPQEAHGTQPQALTPETNTQSQPGQQQQKLSIVPGQPSGGQQPTHGVGPSTGTGQPGFTPAGVYVAQTTPGQAQVTPQPPPGPYPPQEHVGTHDQQSGNMLPQNQQQPTGGQGQPHQGQDGHQIPGSDQVSSPAQTNANMGTQAHPHGQPQMVDKGSQDLNQVFPLGAQPRPSVIMGTQTAITGQEPPNSTQAYDSSGHLKPQAPKGSRAGLSVSITTEQPQDGQYYPVQDDGVRSKTNLSNAESQDDIRPSTHGSHVHAQGKRATNISDAHPGARHHQKHIPVDITSGIKIGEEHPFHDFPHKVDADGKPIEDVTVSNDIVQKELQEQYSKLQGMQRQMASEIQDKMEFIYQKLLREIAGQHLTTSPYMALGAAAETCLGPGVCTGHGMPAGTAVCEFPQAFPEKHDIPFHLAVAGGGATGGKSCPGPGVCPGAAFCPTCKNDALHHIKVPPNKGGLVEQPLDVENDFRPFIPTDLLKEVQSLILLPKDLEDLRRQVKDKGKVPTVFDETEIIEKLATLWEAVNILKGNEEAIAVRIVKQDAALKKLPPGVLDKLHKIPAENLDAIASAHPDRPLVIPSSSNLTKHDIIQLRGMESAAAGVRVAPTNNNMTDDLQSVFTNLSNLLVENAATKEKLENLSDAMHHLDTTVVTKPMLVDAMNDKADKGQMNTKVSYDEFGSSMEDLNSRMQNLLLEVYQKNDAWKNITDHLTEELADKLDKMEIGPLRAYFRHHLQHLEEKVFILTQQMEEPDPAGTRKKLLKDYNCISCDRHVNISGVTNSPMLPIIGPILAGHTTASQRAYEMHKMRMNKSRYDPEGRDLNLIDRPGMKRQGQTGRTSRSPSDGLNDSDVMHLVNRYVGGSHTTVTTSDRIASFKRPSTSPINDFNGTEEMQRPKTAAYYYEE